MAKRFLVVTCEKYIFFFNDTATTEIYTLSLPDALPISAVNFEGDEADILKKRVLFKDVSKIIDRKSTRLNSSHITISHAVFCFKKKNHHPHPHPTTHPPPHPAPPPRPPTPP